MAWIFSLSVECGINEEDAVNMIKHFENVTWHLSGNITIKCQTHIFQDEEAHWWSMICPDHISQVGISNAETAYQMTEVGLLLYQHLLTSPTFRYALVGLEVDEFKTYSELKETSNIAVPGLVLAIALWQDLHRPSNFREFRPGYVWYPYQGEVYQPLMTATELKDRFKELLMV